MTTAQRFMAIIALITKKNTNIVRNYLGADLQTGEILIVKTSRNANISKLEKKLGAKILVPQEEERIAAAASLELGKSEVVEIDSKDLFRNFLDATLSPADAYRRTMNICRG